MTKLLALAVLMASTQTTGKPRLELTIGPNAKGASPGRSITLTLINESNQPVEATAPLMLVPKLIGPDGKPVVFLDWRNQAGYAMPEVPPPPEDPVRPGQRRELNRYTMVDADPAHSLSVPYGHAPLSPGKYVISVSSAFGPMTREMWTAAFVQALHAGNRNLVKRGETPAQAADRAAAAFEKHWAETATFWTGTLSSNELTFTIPASQP